MGASHIQTLTEFYHMLIKYPDYKPVTIEPELSAVS